MLAKSIMLFKNYSLVVSILLALSMTPLCAATGTVSSISPGGKSFGASGGTGAVTVTSPGAWTATSNNNWIIITSGSGLTGNGLVSYTVSNNGTGSARIGSLAIGDMVFSVYQPQNLFSDNLATTAWYFEPINAIYATGLTTGCGNNRFCTDDYVTREQMATFIVRALVGENFPYTPTPYFTDVPESAWSFKYVQKLKDLGLTTSEGAYNPYGNVTREQMAAFIIRAKFGETFTYTVTPYFDDVPSDAWSFKYVQKMKDLGYTTTAGTYGAAENVTRAQMATFLGRAFLNMMPIISGIASTGDSAIAERALAQTGLSIAFASNVLQSQVMVIAMSGSSSLPCRVLNGGGSYLTGTTPTTMVEGHPIYPLTVYYDNYCTQPYIAATVTGMTRTGYGAGVIVETATYYGLNGARLGTLTLNITLLETIVGDAITNVQVHGLSIFTSVGNPQAPVQLGLSCSIPFSTSTDVMVLQCTGALAQDFPALGLAIGAVTSLNLNIASSVTFTGGGSTVTGPISSLAVTNPTWDSFVIQGGTSYTSTTASGGAAAYALFPPTPTGWTLIDSANDEKLQVSVIDNTVRNLSLTITKVSTGDTLVVGTIDQSGTGTIIYSDGRSAAITSWTLAD